MRQPLFGLSAAGHRLEGGFNGPGEPANQWTAWEHSGKVRPVEPGGAGWWSHPDRLLDLASEAGATALAVSVEWARVEPTPGRVDEDAVERYASALASVTARGIVPVAVLHDVAHPAWLGEEFWLTPGSPDRFADHCARLVAALSSACRHWVTLRQANLVALAGWVDGRHPPRRVGALADAWAVVDNLLAAHLLAYYSVHDVQPDAEVLLGLRASPSYDGHRLLVDLLCAPALGVAPEAVDGWVAGRRASHDRLRAPADLGDLAWRRLAAATAPFGSGGLGRPSPRRAVDLAYRSFARTPPATGSNGSTPDEEARYPLDALLVGWIPPVAAPALLPSPRRRAPWDVRPDPGALTAWCLDQASATPGLRLWIEDGFATRGGSTRTDGWDRSSYLRAELDALLAAAVTEGSRIAAYLYYAPLGGGDPTWPDADYGLGDDAAAFRRLVEDVRPAATPPADG